MITSEWITEAMKDDPTLSSMGLNRDDAVVREVLVAAMEWVEDHRPDLSYEGPWTVPAYIQLGTVRLCARWFIRRVSPNGLVQLGEMGSGGIIGPVDPDIANQLGVMGGFS